MLRRFYSHSEQFNYLSIRTLCNQVQSNQNANFQPESEQQQQQQLNEDQDAQHVTDSQNAQHAADSQDAQHAVDDPSLRFYEELIRTRAHMGYNERTFLQVLLGQRNQLSIFDLDKTLISLYRALQMIKQSFDARQQILIVNTNITYQPLVKYTIKAIKKIRNVKVMQFGNN
eukprot:TRINITY_DN7020_c0_g1_i5.p2 TRINITY_DN7020_c0_g1~~TRINITY_DN7020_c0_g1_i5.p2  ORF type:complete len:172 (-),score=14.23 TRINITY_DN7020_c0_g1_i5:469-984(-)